MSKPRRRESDRILRWHGVPLVRALLLAVALIVPGYALRWLALATAAPRLVFGYAAAISLLAFILYWHDKRRAIAAGWRVPEFYLHLVALLGGWPGAFLAQTILRHKNVKVSFQCVFWTIVLLHQLAAFDYVRQWKYTRQLFQVTLRLITDAAPHGATELPGQVRAQTSVWERGVGGDCVRVSGLGGGAFHHVASLC